MYRKILHNRHLAIIGKNLADLRHRNGEKESTVAKAIGVTQAMISKIESGTYEGLKVTTLLKLAEYLCIPVESLFTSANDADS